MIRKLKSGGYRLYSRKANPKTGRRRNLGTFKTRAAAEKHERDVQYFKRIEACGRPFRPSDRWFCRYSCLYQQLSQPRSPADRRPFGVDECRLLPSPAA